MLDLGAVHAVLDLAAGVVGNYGIAVDVFGFSVLIHEVIGVIRHVNSFRIRHSDLPFGKRVMAVIRSNLAWYNLLLFRQT